MRVENIKKALNNNVINFRRVVSLYVIIVITGKNDLLQIEIYFNFILSWWRHLSFNAAIK